MTETELGELDKSLPEWTEKEIGEHLGYYPVLQLLVNFSSNVNFEYSDGSEISTGPEEVIDMLENDRLHSEVDYLEAEVSEDIDGGSVLNYKAGLSVQGPAHLVQDLEGQHDRIERYLGAFSNFMDGSVEKIQNAYDSVKMLKNGNKPERQVKLSGRLRLDCSPEEVENYAVCYENVRGIWADKSIYKDRGFRWKLAELIA